MSLKPFVFINLTECGVHVSLKPSVLGVIAKFLERLRERPSHQPSSPLVADDLSLLVVSVTLESVQIAPYRIHAFIFNLKRIHAQFHRRRALHHRRPPGALARVSPASRRRPPASRDPSRLSRSHRRTVRVLRHAQSRAERHRRPSFASLQERRRDVDASQHARDALGTMRDRCADRVAAVRHRHRRERDRGDGGGDGDDDGVPFRAVIAGHRARGTRARSRFDDNTQNRRLQSRVVSGGVHGGSRTVR